MTTAMKNSFVILVITSWLVVALSTMACQACKVTIDENDVTSDFFVVEDEQQQPLPNPYVNCTDKAVCKNAIIENCPVIKCRDSEACNSAQIINVTHTVNCDGVHSCHSADITFLPKAGDEDDQYQSVMCTGPSACDVTQIAGSIDLVSCKGVKACRKVKIDGASVVKCHEGHENSQACSNFATIDSGCLYCGKNGCADKINQCRYKLLGSSMENYNKCQPVSIVGSCPSDLSKELELEMEGNAIVDERVNDGEDGE